MNDNKINFRVHRTVAGTIFEVLTALLLIAMWVLTVYTMTKLPGNGYDVLGTAVLITIASVMMLVLAYHPRTFNVPGSAKPMHYIITVHLLRVLAVEIALMGIANVCQFHLLIGHGWTSLIATVAIILTACYYMVRLYSVK